MREMDALISYDADGLTWNWRHEDSRMDALQTEIAALAERQATFAQIKAATCQALNRKPWPDTFAPHIHRPGLTEGLVLLSRAHWGAVGSLDLAENSATISLIER